MADSRRQKYLKRYEALKRGRASWEPTFRDIGDYILPGRWRASKSDTNNGIRKDSKVLTAIATWAVQTQAAGMCAGVSSKSRPWFRMTVADTNLAEYGPVRDWLYQVEQVMRQVLAKSNIYNSFSVFYQDLAAFGTAALLMDEDEQDFLRTYVVAPGEYVISNSARLKVDTIYCETQMSVEQMVEAFTLEKCSKAVQNQYQRGNYEQTIPVIHLIQPNRNRDMVRADYRGMPWNSCWFEANGPASDDSLLKESGYHSQPFAVARWEVGSSDIWGRGCGHQAIGDVKQLQLVQKRKLELVDKSSSPPMVGPASVRNRGVGLMPGDYTEVDASAYGAKVEPLLRIDPASITVTQAEAAELREAIKQHFHADLWLMLDQLDRGQMTAREVDERASEKLQQLGPVLERMDDELFDPVFDRAFDMCLRAGRIPKPPEELQGAELRTDYISIAFQAQKALGVPAIERLYSFGGNLAAVKPDVLDKLNFDEAVDQMADYLGVNPKLVVPDEQVAQVRQARAQQQQQMAAAEQAATVSQGAKTLSETDLGGDTALSRIMSAFGSRTPTTGAA